MALMHSEWVNTQLFTTVDINVSTLKADLWLRLKRVPTPSKHQKTIMERNCPIALCEMGQKRGRY